MKQFVNLFLEQEKQAGQITQHLVKNAKQILHLMEESKETVAALQDDLAVEEDKSAKLLNILHKLKETCNQNTATLEISKDQNEYLTQLNKKFLDFAELIYSACQGLYKDIEQCDDESQKMELVLAENEERILQKQNEYEIEKNTLNAELQQAKQQKEAEDDELKAIEEENKQLQLKIENIKRDNETKRKNNERIEILVETQNKHVLENIEKFTKVISKLDQNYLQLASAKETEDEQLSNNRTDLENFIHDLDIKIADLIVEAQEKDNIFKDAQQKNQNIQNLSEEVQQRTYTKENNQKQHTEMLLDMQQKMKETENDAAQKLVSLKTTTADFKINLATKRQFREKLIEEQSIIDIKYNELCTKLAQLREANERLRHIPKPDLEKEIKKLDQEYTEIKSSLQTLNETYEIDKNNNDDKIKTEKLEIIKLENSIKLQNQAIKGIELSISANKTELEKIMIENKENKVTLNDICEEIKLTKVKHERQQNSRKLPRALPKRMDPPKKKHWDSDSSMELVDSPALIEIRERQRYKRKPGI